MKAKKVGLRDALWGWVEKSQVFYNRLGVLQKLKY